MGAEARLNQRVRELVAQKEQEIVNIIFTEFMKCLKPKPKYLPQWLWWTISNIVFDLKKSETLNPHRTDALEAEITKEVIDDKKSV